MNRPSIASLIAAQDRATVPAPLYLVVSPSLAAVANAYHARLSLAVRVHTSDHSYGVDPPDEPAEAVARIAELTGELDLISIDGAGRPQQWEATCDDGPGHNEHTWSVRRVAGPCDFCGEPEHRGECAEAAYVHDVASGRVQP